MNAECDIFVVPDYLSQGEEDSLLHRITSSNNWVKVNYRYRYKQQSSRAQLTPNARGLGTTSRTASLTLSHKQSAEHGGY